MIYEPAEDSHLLEGEVRKRAQGKRVLDMGAGSGILATAARDAKAKEILCVDIDPDVVEHLKHERFDAVQSDLFERVKGMWDLIVFNPPYLPKDEREDAESERITSGGTEGDEIILRFLRNAGSHLARRGIILLLVSSLTPSQKIEKLLTKEKLRKKIVAQKNVFMETLKVWEIRK